MFACLMFMGAITFMMMTMFYHYKPNSLYTPLQETGTEEMKGAYVEASPASGAMNAGVTTGNNDVISDSSTELVPLHMRKMTITPVE